MPKKKYNREQIKLDYFESTEVSAVQFIRGLYGVVKVSGNTKKKIKGWTRDKKKFIQGIKQQALLEIEKEAIEDYKPSMKDLSWIHKNIMGLIKAKITGMAGKDLQHIEQSVLEKMNTKDIETLRKIVKTEKGEPTTVSKSEVSTEDGGYIVIGLPHNGRKSGKETT